MLDLIKTILILYMLFVFLYELGQCKTILTYNKVKLNYNFHPRVVFTFEESQLKSDSHYTLREKWTSKKKDDSSPPRLPTKENYLWQPRRAAGS